ASLAFALAAGIALEAGQASRALEIAERALDLDPRRADALAVAERAATAADTEQLARIYERLGAASLGCYGERALNYRAARQLEKRGDAGRALERAIRAFEAVPSEGAAYVLMARLSERTPRSSEVVASLERVAAQCSGVEARAAWLRRAALFADASEEGRRQRVEVLLRALSTRADVATLRSLGEAFGALLELVPEDKDILELRLERALSSVLPGADGPEGARMAVEAARVALVAFDSAELAVRALTQATKADGSIDEFESLQPFVPRLANAPEAARAYVTETVKSAGNRFSNLGRACLELVASVASEFDDSAARAHLLVHAARRDPDDRELVRRAERAVQSAREPELEALLLEAVPLADRVLRLLERARAPEEPEERATACATLEQALAGAELVGELRARVFRELCELYGQTGRRDDLERLLAHEAERPGLESAARLLALRDLAALVAARGEPERALSLLLAATSEPIDDELMLADIATLAQQTGAKRAQADALARLVDLTPEPAPKASALRELAAVLEALGESLAAASRWSELARLDPGDLTALMALERDAEARGDYAELNRVLGLRAVQATDPDDVRRIRLRRAVMLEQRLGRADEAREELETLLVATGDALSVLRVLADLNERLGSELQAAPLWLRASAVARDRDEAAALGRRASVAYLRGGDVDGARRVIEGMQAWAASPELARLKVDVERHGQSPLELAEALEELSRTVGDAHERAALLSEAARAALAAHDDAGALARATRASRAEPTSAEAQLLSRWLEYLSRRGPGTAEQARASAAELRSIAEPLTPAQQELHSFLLAEALDVAVGIGAGMRELTRAHAEIGPLPLIALGTAERLSTGGEPARALGLFDAALAGDLQRMRTHAAVALSAARSAQAAGELERALSYLELAAQDDARRAEALVLQAEIREQLKPVTDAASFGGDVLRPDPDVANEAGDSDALNAAKRYSSRPPPSLATLEAAASPKVRASRRPEASPPQEAERPANLAFPPADRAEEALLQALAKGSIEAGKELIARLENRAGRAHDWVVVCRRVAALLPGDLWTLDKLHDAAFADRNPEYGRAIEHVIAVFRGRASEVPAPPLEEQAEQPDWVRAMLFRDAVQVANEALGLVWEGAEHVFRRDHGLYGVTGLERIAYGGQNAIAGMYSSAAFALGLARTPLFQRRSAGSITVSIALLSPPALILSGEVQGDSPELCFHLGSMLGATLSPYLLLFGSPENQVRAILKALRLAFGAHEERGSLASVANLAEVLWESIPARSQRRLRELCSDPSALSYEAALASAKTATRRAGLFVAGDLAVAVRETCADENIPADLLAAPNGLSALCSSSPAVADLVRLATSPEYAETRWQVNASGRHSSNKWATIPGASRNR
ncbi:MAG TPA: hypothetical protein VI072_24300, partial [Polyangiaceae bacterium]